MSHPSTVPSPSDTVPVILTAYDSSGRVSSTTDPQGTVRSIGYDGPGRTVETVVRQRGGIDAESGLYQGHRPLE